MTLVFVLVAASSASGSAPAPADRQLDWIVSALNAGTTPSAAVLEQHFTAGFLKAVPPAQVIEGLTSIAAERPLRVAATLERQGSQGLEVRLVGRSGAALKITIHVTGAAPHLIDGLLLEPIAAPAKSWQEVDRVLHSVAANVGLYAGEADGTPIHELAATRAGAIGSAFKLYVLGALGEAVAAGRAGWDEKLAIHGAWKSLPSGDMRNLPDGKRFTVRHYAEQMISVSDNTAADHLIHLVGRPAVEAQLGALGNSVPARNEPFLTTRELFALKLAAPAPLRDAFARAGTAKRRELLPRIDALVPVISQGDSWIAPRQISTLEWFASPRDLAHAIALLVARAQNPKLAPIRAILSINPGVDLDASVWRYVAFKGGSEPGVISLTWYLTRHDGRSFVLSIVLNDNRHQVDTSAAVSAAESAIALLARS